MGSYRNLNIALFLFLVWIFLYFENGKQNDDPNGMWKKAKLEENGAMVEESKEKQTT